MAPIRIRTVLIVAAFLAACGGESTVVTPPPPQIALSLVSTSAWAGGPITLRLRNFQNPFGSAALTLGTATVALSRVDDSTLSGVLPRTLAAGSAASSAQLNGIEYQLPPITIAGFASVTTMPRVAYGGASLWYRDGHPMVVNPTTTGQLGLYDLEAGTLSEGPGFSCCWLYGPGPSIIDGAFLTRTRADDFQLWQLDGTPALVASYPINQGSTADPSDWVMKFGENLFFTASTHMYRIWRTSGPTGLLGSGAPQLSGQMDGMEGVVLSPRKDRATLLLGATAEAGIPVFDVVNGNIAYHAMGLQSNRAAAFSPDGELLAVGGRYGIAGPGKLLLLNATTGAVLRDSSLTTLPGAAGFDRVRPWLYVVMPQAVGPAYLLVLERESFKMIAEMEIPGQNGPNCCTFGTVAPSPATNSVFLAIKGKSYQFTLPPK